MRRKPLRRIPRNEHPRPREELKAEELRIPLDVRDGFALDAPVDESLEAAPLLLGDVVVPIELLPDDVLEQILGLDPLASPLPVIERW